MQTEMMRFLQSLDCKTWYSMQGDNDPVDVVEIGSQTGVMGAVYKASTGCTGMLSATCVIFTSKSKQPRMTHWLFS